MKKKLIIGGVIGLVVILAIVLVLVLGHKKDEKEDNDSVVSTVTLDINPSIELGLNKKNEILEVKALNDDAKDFIDGLKGKSWDDALNVITDKVIEKGYVSEDGRVVILLNAVGEAKGAELENGLRHVMGEKNVDPDVIIVEDITDGDKDLAKELGISPAKAAYINSITKENDKVSVEDLAKRSVSELKETKESGRFCDEGWTLEGEFCTREKTRKPATKEGVCPKDSVEVKGVCYKTADANKEEFCTNGLTLKNGKCVGTETVAATAKCSTGEFNSKTGKCEKYEYASEGSKKCPSSEQKLLDNGRCASPHMGAHFDDPEGTIDPATECCCGDTWYPDNSLPSRGWCYSPAGNADPITTCPSGQTAKDGKCYKVTTSDPTYSCSSGKLDGTKCIVDVSKNPNSKKVCDSGLTLFEDRVCYNKNETVEKEGGYACKDKDSKLDGDQCIIMEIKEANK